MATAVQHPTKEQVRAWMRQRQVEHAPPPTPQDIRRELGWQLDIAYDPLRRECTR